MKAHRKAWQRRRQGAISARRRLITTRSLFQVLGDLEPPRRFIQGQAPPAPRAPATVAPPGAAQQVAAPLPCGQTARRPTARPRGQEKPTSSACIGSKRGGLGVPRATTPVSKRPPRSVLRRLKIGDGVIGVDVDLFRRRSLGASPPTGQRCRRPPPPDEDLICSFVRCSGRHFIPCPGVGGVGALRPAHPAASTSRRPPCRLPRHAPRQRSELHRLQEGDDFSRWRVRAAKSSGTSFTQTSRFSVTSSRDRRAFPVFSMMDSRRFDTRSRRRGQARCPKVAILFRSWAAVLGPMPGMPGILSTESPVSATVRSSSPAARPFLDDFRDADLMILLSDRTSNAGADERLRESLSEEDDGGVGARFLEQCGGRWRSDRRPRTLPFPRRAGLKRGLHGGSARTAERDPPAAPSGWPYYLGKSSFAEGFEE